MCKFYEDITRFSFKCQELWVYYEATEVIIRPKSSLSEIILDFLSGGRRKLSTNGIKLASLYRFNDYELCQYLHRPHSPAAEINGYLNPPKQLNLKLKCPPLGKARLLEQHYYCK